MIDGNRYFGPISQSVDLILNEAAHKRGLARQDQQRQERIKREDDLLLEARNREDQRQMAQQRWNLAGEFANDNALSDDTRELANRSRLKMAEMAQFPIEYKPRETKPGDELFALPSDPNDEFYKIFPSMKDQAGRKVWSSSEMRQWQNSFATRKESNRHNTATESRLLGRGKSKSGSKNEKNELRKFQMSQLKQTQAALQEKLSLAYDPQEKTAIEKELKKVSRDLVRLGQKLESSYDTTDFEKFTDHTEHPLQFQGQQAGDTPIDAQSILAPQLHSQPGTERISPDQAAQGALMEMVKRLMGNQFDNTQLDRVR